MIMRSLRLGLSLIVAVGCGWTRLEAQEPRVPMIVDYAPVETAPAMEPQPAHRGIRLASWPLFGRPAPVREQLNQHGYGCQSQLDWYGCGGWRQQLTFVLGSCRSFFGEPCMPGVPHRNR
jgi:hypothetical protein